MHKISETIRYVFKAFIVALKSKFDLILLNYWLSEQERMGQIAHLRNSLNQEAHLRKALIKLIKRKNIISFLKMEWSLFVKTSLTLVKIGPMGLEKKIL